MHSVKSPFSYNIVLNYRQKIYDTCGVNVKQVCIRLSTSTNLIDNLACCLFLAFSQKMINELPVYDKNVYTHVHVQRTINRQSLKTYWQQICYRIELENTKHLDLI